MKKIILLPALFLILAMSDAQAGDVVVIGHPGIGKLDAVTVQKIFTGKLIKVGGIDVTAVNVKPGPLRDHFLRTFLNQNDEKYTAYWTMRHFIGKGAPPIELPNATEVIKFVRSTPGAIGYIDEDDVLPQVSVIARK
jgi:hypothetical protein